MYYVGDRQAVGRGSISPHIMYYVGDRQAVGRGSISPHIMYYIGDRQAVGWGSSLLLCQDERKMRGESR